MNRAAPPSSRPDWLPYLGGAALICAIILVLTALTIWQDSVRHQERAEVASKNTAKLLAQHISDIFDRADATLKTVAYYHAEHRQQGDIHPARFNAYMEQLLRAERLFADIRVVDSEGILRFGTDRIAPVSVVDRDYFIRARASSPASQREGLIFTEPLFARLKKKWVLIVARRLDNPDGSFAGVVFVTLDTVSFGKLFASLDNGQAGTIALRTQNLAQVDSYPNLPDPQAGTGNRAVSRQLQDAIKVSPAGGAYIATSPLDQQQRHYTYLKLDPYPFYIIVGQYAPRFVPDWSAGVFALLGFSGLMILVTLGGAWQLYHLAQQRARLYAEAYAEQKAGIILESSPLAIVLIDANNVVRRANQAATELFGYPLNTLIGLPGERLVVARHHAIQSELVEQFLRPATPHARRTSVELVGVHSGGGEIPLQTSLSAIDIDGVRHGILVLEDLTVRKHTENSVRELLSLQSAILIHSPYAIMTSRPNGTLTLFNPAAERMLGYRAGEVVGRHTPALFHTSEDNYDFDALMAEVRQTSPLSGQASYKRKDGSHFTAARSISTLLDEHGGITGYLCILADVTEQLANEKLIQLTLARLRLATQLADIAIWSWDLSDNHLQWDDLLCRWYQVPQEVRERGITYDYWRSRTHPDDVAPLEVAMAETIRTGQPGGGSFRVTQADGSVRYYESLWVLERDESGQAVTLLGVNQDVTTQREYDNGLRAAKEAAEAANQAKSDFLANISHEIRTPMNAIIGLTELTLKTELNARQRDYLDKVHNSSTVLLQLLNDILDYAKIEAGHQAIEKHPFELAEVVNRVAGLFAHSLEARHVTWHLDLDPALPRHFCGDALRLGQVLTNLVGNAVKFTPQGEVRLSLSLASETAQHVTLRGVVSDTGIGMSADDISRVFTAFAQADTSVSRQYGGTGLGLSIVRRLVGLMGGEVTVQSVPGKGSTFQFTVKLERVTDNDGPALVQTIPRLMAPTVGRTHALSNPDRARLDVLLHELAQLLSAHRLTAKRVNEDIESLLEGSTYTDAFRPVADAVRQLKFTDAQEALKTFHAALAASS